LASEPALQQTRFATELDYALEDWWQQHRSARRVTCSRAWFREHSASETDGEGSSYHVDFRDLAHAAGSAGVSEYKPVRATDRQTHELVDVVSVWFAVIDEIANCDLTFLYLPDEDRFVSASEYSAERVTRERARAMFVPRMRRGQAYIFRNAAVVPGETAAPVHGRAVFPAKPTEAPRISMDSRCYIWKEMVL